MNRASLQPTPPAMLKVEKELHHPVSSTSNQVFAKLGVITAAMVILPISSYFLSIKYIFAPTNTTAAGITAAVVANLVLVAFIVLAIQEDRADQALEANESKKSK